tara:strand:- start:966 stop:1379 length:414 start_codon:yes stop_codon:yes gene_type:complete
MSDLYPENEFVNSECSPDTCANCNKSLAYLTMINIGSRGNAYANTYTCSNLIDKVMYPIENSGICSLECAKKLHRVKEFKKYNHNKLPNTPLIDGCGTGNKVKFTSNKFCKFGCKGECVDNEFKFRLDLYNDYSEDY